MNFPRPLLFLNLFSIYFCFLDNLTSHILQDLRSCLLQKQSNLLLNCDNQIYSFYLASNSAISEIFNLFKQESMSKVPSVIFPGIQSGTLRLLSSSSDGPSSQATRARMNLSKREGDLCWRSINQTTDHYLQVSSPFPVQFHSISTQGNTEYDSYVKSYRILYSLTGYDWEHYNSGQVFVGNEDKSTVVSYKLTPFAAKAVRINPLTWNTRICTRLEFNISKLFYNPLPPTPPGQVLVPGISAGFNVITSSIYNQSYSSDLIMINHRSAQVTNAWCPGFYNAQQWVAVTSPVPVFVQRISLQGRTQGASLGKLLKFWITYTLDGINWIDYKNKENFDGCFDNWSIVSLELDGFYAISVRIYSDSWTNEYCARVEVYVRI